MFRSNFEYPPAIAGNLIVGLFLAVLIPQLGISQEDSTAADRIAPTLVQVRITTEREGTGEAEINGQRISGYHPRIIEMFPSVGVVIDDLGHVLTFLGYRWVDVQFAEKHIDLITGEGQKCRAKLVGIDQSIGVAIVRALGVKLKRTPLCFRCEIQDGTTIVTPILESPGISQFRRSQIRSIGYGREPLAKEQWVLRVDRPLPGVGTPLLDTDHRVLGFVASQEPSAEDPMGFRTVVYPVSQLLGSAEKIIKARGDIRTGWLGVYLGDDARHTPNGVTIKRVEADSPAQKAGLNADDVILTWNGNEVRDPKQFISLVQDTPIGSKVDLNLMRDGKPVTATAFIDARKPPEQSERLVLSFANYSNIAPPLDARERVLRIGIDAVPLTEQLANFLQIPAQPGLLVSHVASQTPFANAGVAVGDVIVAVDGQPVMDPHQLFAEIEDHRRGGRLNLKILRKGVDILATVEFPPPAKQ